jgi:hypothetical protein
LKIPRLLLGNRHGISAGDEAARRELLVGDYEKCLRELGRVASLPAVLRLISLLLTMSY